MIWTTKSLEKDRKYVVIKHNLKGVNCSINGIKFRDSYAVVEKDSKTYFSLKKIPVLSGFEEFSLLYLRKLKFITRTSDIKTIYGQDVYIKFLNEEQTFIKAEEERIKLEKEQKELEENNRREEELKLKLEIEKKLEEIEDEELAKELKESIPTNIKCACRTKDGTLCKWDAVDFSPSGYCIKHITEDPKLSEFGLEMPNMPTKEEKTKFREKVKKTLIKAKKENKF